MKRWPNSRTLITLAGLVLLPILCGAVVLLHSAPRDWSLHWVAPQTAAASTSGDSLAAASTPSGWSALWTSPNGALRFARFSGDRHRLGRTIALSGSPQALALGAVAGSDVAVWRQDTNGGSELRAAILRPGRPPVYRSLVRGPWALEHPQAFTAGKDVDVVFSWQKTVFDVYLIRISPNGEVSSPVRLTHAAEYAFNPRATTDALGALQLVYMDQCCGGSIFRVVTARYSPDGRPLSKPIALDRIASAGGQNSSAAPTDWGLDIATVGRQSWIAWAGDDGLALARLGAGGVVAQRQTVVRGATTTALRLVADGSAAQLVWEQNFSLGSMLATVTLGPNRLPISAPDRVAYESASDSNPVGLNLGGRPGMVWQAAPAKSTTSRIEVSHFTPGVQAAPNVWAKLGLGLANPLGNLFLLLLGAVALGALIAAGNVFLAFGLVVLYLLAVRLIPRSFRWYAFTAMVGVALYVLLVNLGAPFPPIIFFSGLSAQEGLVAVGGMVLFVLLFSWLALRRIDDVFRAAAMAFTSLYFLAFLQALTIMQDQLGKI